MLEFLLIISLSIIIYFLGCVRTAYEYLKREKVKYNPFKLTFLIYFKIIPANKYYFRHALLFNLYLVCVVTCLESDRKIPLSTIKLITNRAMIHY